LQRILACPPQGGKAVTQIPAVGELEKMVSEKYYGKIAGISKTMGLCKIIVNICGTINRKRLTGRMLERGVRLINNEGNRIPDNVPVPIQGNARMWIINDSMRQFHRGRIAPSTGGF